MAKAIVQHHVADYGRWYPVFKEHGDVRRAHGATGHAIFRATDDPNTVVIVNDFSTVEGARSFATDPSLPEVMKRAGVDSAPQVWICDEEESETY